MTWINITDIKTISPKLKERFCKDCNIPIKIFEEPYFLDRLKLYHEQFDALNKWMKFLFELEKYKSEQEYFEEYKRVKEAAMESIKNSDGYHKFLEMDMSRLIFNFDHITAKDIFHPDNDGRIFLSIDMKQANYSALNNFSADIFGYKDSWEDFLRQFTNNEHIINSKYIRQVILGNCDPRRQVTLEKYLMDEVLSSVLNISAGKLLEQDVVSFSNDEIVIDITDKHLFFALYVRIAKYCFYAFTQAADKVPLHVECFKLRKIKGIDGYIKESVSYEKVKIKGVDSNYLPLVIRKLKNERITDEDLVFVHNGYLAKLINVPKIEV